MDGGLEKNLVALSLVLAQALMVLVQWLIGRNGKRDHVAAGEPVALESLREDVQRLEREIASLREFRHEAAPSIGAIKMIQPIMRSLRELRENELPQLRERLARLEAES